MYRIGKEKTAREKTIALGETGSEGKEEERRKMRKRTQCMGDKTFKFVAEGRKQKE